MEYTSVSETDLPVNQRRGGGRPWDDCAAAACEHPGQWLEVEDHGMSDKGTQVYASRIRLGKLKAFEPKGAFDALNDGSRLFVSYVGEKEA